VGARVLWRASKAAKRPAFPQAFAFLIPVI